MNNKVNLVNSYGIIFGGKKKFFLKKLNEFLKFAKDKFTWTASEIELAARSTIESRLTIDLDYNRILKDSKRLINYLKSIHLYYELNEKCI